MNPDTYNIQLSLSTTLEKLVVIIVLTITLAIFLMAISPMLGTWSYFAFILIYIALLPYMLRNYKSTSKPKEEEHIILYNNGINVNYYGYMGTYPLNNIISESIKIKYIFVSRGGNIGINKGLCFTTISPRMEVKIPLPVLEPSLSKINNAIKALTSA